MEETKEEKTVTQPEEKKAEEKAKGGFNVKVLLFGLPIFIIQLVAVYFVTANILLPKIQSHSAAAETKDSANVDQKKSEDSSKHTVFGKFVYVVEDLIINPAGTDGKRLLLSSIGFDLSSEHNQQTLKEKEVIVKDAVISVLGSKNMSQLGDAVYRDTLRMQITQKLGHLMPDVKINNVYFSKYILQ
ncbi:MAG: flagellar basal body-associated FliL family protein [Ignavibacteriales bacterium]|nr:flagellar basal body-associated FliL family protein [Ignavibacteriales bacterium]